jgi:hypothetical protein
LLSGGIRKLTAMPQAAAAGSAKVTESVVHPNAARAAFLFLRQPSHVGVKRCARKSTLTIILRQKSNLSLTPLIRG